MLSTEYDFLLFIMAQMLMTEKHNEQTPSLDSDSNTAISFKSETELNNGTEAGENNSNKSPSHNKI
jgi:hypothetical protein